MNPQQGESSNVGIGQIERQSNAGSEVVFRNTEEDFESLRGIPAFESFLQKFLVEDRANRQVIPATPKVGGGDIEIQNKGTNMLQEKSDTGKLISNNPAIKSPSDTTIYAPAFMQAGVAINNAATNLAQIGGLHTLISGRTIRAVHEQQTLITPSGEETVNTNAFNANVVTSQVSQKDGNDMGISKDSNMINQIINFIEGIRVQAQGRPLNEGNRQNRTDSQDSQQSSLVRIAQHKADQNIILAEKFKANVNSPQGNVNTEILVEHGNDGPNINKANNLTDLDVDDQFFHIMCHLDEGLRSKIERGEYVDLEKLLPKIRGKPNQNDNHMDLVYKDGHSYFVPVASDTKIMGVRKWEQAFRIYATVYCQANPLRAAEIWQYVYTINSVESAYIWDNVYQYNITFRQLMSQYPNRSWAKIYNQMWSLTMREPIQRNTATQWRNNQSHAVAHTNGQGTQNASQGEKIKCKKPNYCWAFNKGFCKDGAACKFVNRCSYCDAADHALPNCQKAKEANAKKN